MMTEFHQQHSFLKLSPGNNGQTLCFFGTRHTNNPGDEQFPALMESWNEFLREKNGEAMVMVEGATREIPEAYEEAIREYGEAGAMHWLARKEGIEVIRPELSEKEQRQLLCAAYSPELVAYAVIAQNLAGWSRHVKQESFQDALNRVLLREATFADVYGLSPNSQWLQTKHEELFPDQDLEDKNFLYSITDPRKDSSVINEVVAARSALRNKHLLEIIEQAWKSKKNIFVVYGSGHLASLEPELRNLGN